MQPGRGLPRTTHTLEMAQIAALNDRLRARAGDEVITAADLDLQGTALLSPGHAAIEALPAESVLDDLCYDGPPEFPYIHAHFRPDPGEAGSVTVDLHTTALRELGRLLHLHGVWGIGSEDAQPAPWHPGSGRDLRPPGHDVGHSNHT